jgi:hypothetical protein
MRLERRFMVLPRFCTYSSADLATGASATLESSAPQAANKKKKGSKKGGVPTQDFQYDAFTFFARCVEALASCACFLALLWSTNVIMFFVLCRNKYVGRLIILRLQTLLRPPCPAQSPPILLKVSCACVACVEMDIEYYR